MRKLGVWGVAASLALGLAVQRATANDEPAVAPWPQKGLLDYWFGSSAPMPTPEKKKKTAAEEAAEARARADQKRAEARKAYDDVLRREAVCDRLAESAERTHDVETQKLVEDLRKRAWEIYWKKTGRRSGGTSAGAEVDEAKAPRESSTSTASPRRGKP
jgi:hypothetical protein